MTANVYSEGDLVEAIKGESRVRGRIAHMATGAGIIGMTGTLTSMLELAGYTITVIEKAPDKVVLPTEPGAYVTNRGSVFVLNSDRDWLDFSLWRGSVNNPAAANPAYHPFTRLEPALVTAKKVLDRMNTDLDDDRYLDFDPFLKKVAAEFGVEL